MGLLSEETRFYGNSPAESCSLTMDTSSLYPLETSFSGGKYTSSLYDLSQDVEPGVEEESASVALSRIVDDMLASSIATTESFSCAQSTHSEVVESQNDLEKNNKPYNLHSSDKSIMTKSEFDLKDDFGSFSDHDLQSNSVVSSDNYASMLCPMEVEHCSSPYKETKSDVESGMVKPTCLEQRNYDTSSLMYDTDDMTMFSGLVNCDEVLKNHKRKSGLNIRNETIVCCYRSGSSSTSNEGDCVSKESSDKKLNEGNQVTFFSQQTATEDTDSRKGKISGLQRRALDSIFNVIDRPSRGLVLHIAGELSLHHITVKNFFSNGRRRLRRAAARLSDPERTRRENQKRKEKRRLAALAAAASVTNGEKAACSPSKCSLDSGTDYQSPREPPVLSPERRALMEKLAVKVQRSVAQRWLASGIAESTSLSNSPGSSTGYNHNSITSSTKHLENNTISPQLHSNYVTAKEPTHTFALQQVEDSFLNHNGEAFGSLFSYSESEPLTSYNSSPDQNSVSNYSSEPENTNSYVFVDEEGPFSPTSWQTLLHT